MNSSSSFDVSNPRHGTYVLSSTRTSNPSNISSSSSSTTHPQSQAQALWYPSNSSAPANPAASNIPLNPDQSATTAVPNTNAAGRLIREKSDRFIIKLTVGLMNTYNAINEKYYANKRKRLLDHQQRQAEQQRQYLQQAQSQLAPSQSSANAAATSATAATTTTTNTSNTAEQAQTQAPQQYNDGYDDKDYNYIVFANEVLNNRYIVDHSIGKGSFGK